MNLGARLKKAFDMCGTRAPDVSRASGVPVATINTLMRRDSVRSAFTEQILAVLPQSKINHDWVRTGQGTPEPVVHGHAPTSPGKKDETDGGRKNAPAPTVAIEVGGGGEAVGLGAAPLRSWEHPGRLPEGNEWVFIPKLGVVQGPSYGPNGFKTILMTSDIHAFRAHWIRQDQFDPAMLAWHDAVDDSMAPMICAGDSFVVDTSQAMPLVDGKTYAIWYGGALRARQVILLPTGGVRLVAMNTAFQSMDVPASDVGNLNIVGRIVRREGKGGL